MNIFCWVQDLQNSSPDIIALYEGAKETVIEKSEIEKYLDLISETKLSSKYKKESKIIKFYYSPDKGCLFNINLGILDCLGRNNSVVLFVPNADIQSISIDEVVAVIDNFIREKVSLSNIDISQLKSEFEVLKKKTLLITWIIKVFKRMWRRIQRELQKLQRQSLLSP